MSTVLASKDDIVAQLLAMKQELSSLSLRGASRGTQQRKSPVRRQSAVETGDGEFAELAPARMSLPLSDADAACHYKRTVGRTLHESAVAAVVTAAGVRLAQDQQASKMQPTSRTCPQLPVHLSSSQHRTTRCSYSDSLIAADEPAQRPAPLGDHFLRRSARGKRVRFDETVEVKYISPPERMESGMLSLRPTPNADILSERHGVPALCSLNCSFLTMAVESSKGAGFDKVMASIPIGDLVSTLFPGRFDMFRLSYTKGGRNDHVYCCNPAHDDKTRDDSSWMMEWLLVFKRTGVAVVAHSDARL